MINVPDEHVDQYIKLFKDKDIQLDILQEECSELIKEISKYKRSLKSPGVGNCVENPIDGIIEEMAHVAISSEIVAKILGITKDDIQAEINKKAEKFGIKEFSHPDIPLHSRYTKDVLHHETPLHSRCIGCEYCDEVNRKCVREGKSGAIGVCWMWEKY